jgi:protein tyrosine/serine phosphatase
MRNVALASLLLFVAACGGGGTDDNASAGEAAETAPPITNFHEVRPGLYRGAHPDDAGLDYLKSIGVKTIVDLEVADLVEAMPWDITGEEKAAKARGIVWLHEPMSAFELGLSDRFDNEIESILAVLKDKAQGPVYVHCKHGQDRTGLVIGLERVLIEGWNPADAHDEMVKIGFHTGFLGLEDYFERKTNWNP